METNILSRLFYLFIGLTSFLFIGCQSNGDEEETIVTFSAETQKMFEDGVLFASTGGEQMISFTSNKNWSVELKGEEVWCMISPLNEGTGDGSFNISVVENDDSSDRSVTLLFTSGTVSKEMTIRQAGKTTKKIANVVCHYGKGSYTNQELTTYEYDNKGRIAKIVTLGEREYTYSYEDSKITVVNIGNDLDDNVTTIYYLENGLIVRSVAEDIERTYKYDAEKQLVKETDGGDSFVYTWEKGNIIKTEYFNDAKDVFNYTYTDKPYEFIGGDGSDDILCFSLSEAVLWNEGRFGKCIKNMIKACDNGFHYEYEYNADGSLKQVEELGDEPYKTKWVIAYK